ncbi:MAG: transporter substrate-binding domain-containing protein [Acidimicrobiales bacterium]
MRRLLLVTMVVVFAAGLSACGSATSSTTTTTAAATGTSTATGPLGATCTNAAIQGDLYHKGQLTIATDNPVYTPWFVNNRPENGQGYEGAVAYGIAAALGFTTSEVKWAYEPFNDSYSPGPKHFDFDINEISVTAARAQQVTFSISYYADDQALVVLKNGPVAKDHSPAALKTYQYGDQIGTTSLAFISQYIQPTKQTRVYGSLNDVKTALDTHQIQAFVTDTPTAQYIAADEIPGSEVVGQFPSTGEYFGLLFHKGDQLVTCVNKAIEHLRSDGSLASYSKKYLQIYNAIPTIKP